MFKPRFSVVPIVAVAGLLAAGCGGDDNDSTSASTQAAPAASSAMAPDSSMAETMAGSDTMMGSESMEHSDSMIRRRVHHGRGRRDADRHARRRAAGRAHRLLQEHVYLAGIAVHAASPPRATPGRRSASAIAALDANSVALSKAVGSVYPDAEQPFLDPLAPAHRLLRRLHPRQGDQGQGEGRPRPRRTSTATAPRFGQLINSVVPELPADAVAEELMPHVQTLFAAIDAVVAGRPDQYKLLQHAADHMPMTADILAGGIAEQGPRSRRPATPRPPSCAPASPRQLQEHVYLAGIAIRPAVAKDGDLDRPRSRPPSPPSTPTRSRCPRPSARVYPDAEQPFLASWRQHIGFFVDYTLGKATKDAAMVDKAKTDLDGYRTSFGQLINSVVPELPADAVAEELKPHVADAVRRHRRRGRREPGVFPSSR